MRQGGINCRGQPSRDIGTIKSKLDFRRIEAIGLRRGEREYIKKPMIANAENVFRARATLERL